MFFFQINPTSLYLKEAYGSALEFPDSSGNFDLEHHADSTAFIVSHHSSPPVSVSSTSAAAASSLQPSVAVTPQATSNQRLAVTPRQRVLASVRITQAELGPDGKPSNVNVRGSTVYINLYKEEQACIPYLTRRAREEIGDVTLILVNNSGNEFVDQDGTRG